MSIISIGARIFQTKTVVIDLSENYKRFKIIVLEENSEKKIPLVIRRLLPKLPDNSFGPQYSCE